jgi:hypothetical protein
MDVSLVESGLVGFGADVDPERPYVEHYEDLKPRLVVRAMGVRGPHAVPRLGYRDTPG